MNFKDALKKKAKETGQVTIQGTAKEPVKADKAKDVKGFCAMLKAKKAISTTSADAIPTNTVLGPVDKWSFSGLKNWESCPHSIKLAKIDREPQKQGEAAARGSIIHDMCEQYVRGQIPTLEGDAKTKFEHFTSDFSQLKRMFDEQVDGQYPSIEMEENWGIRLDWSGCDWEDPELWGRGKLDVFVRESETSCRIIDYKTGRKFGNEMKHNDQGLSYAIYALHRFNKEITHFSVEFWYLDQGEKMVRTFSARQLEILHPRYNKRALRMTTDTEFKSKANADTCRFCNYGANKSKKGVGYGTGVCKNDFYGTLDDFDEPSDEEGNQEL